MFPGNLAWLQRLMGAAYKYAYKGIQFFSLISQTILSQLTDYFKSTIFGILDIWAIPNTCHNWKDSLQFTFPLFILFCKAYFHVVYIHIYFRKKIFSIRILSWNHKVTISSLINFSLVVFISI